jgi:hypothetical protein
LFPLGTLAAHGKHHLQCQGENLSGFVQPGVFDDHVLKLTGFEDVAALQTFDEFGVFLASHNLHARVFTLIRVASLVGGLRRRD